MLTRYRRQYGLLILMFAAGCFLVVPLDILNGDYDKAVISGAMGVVALFTLPRLSKPRLRPKPRRI
jgi:hypothetical protein